MSKYDYEEDTKVDLYNLHLESQRQPDLYIKWAKRYAKAVAETKLHEDKLRIAKAEAKRDLDETRAELDIDIRINFGEYGFSSKPTEAAILNTILIHSRYKKVNKTGQEAVRKASLDHIRAVEDEETLAGMKVAMSHKKNSIENEISLWLAGYYSDPKIPKVLEDQEQRTTKQELKKRLNKRRRIKNEEKQ